MTKLAGSLPGKNPEKQRSSIPPPVTHLNDARLDPHRKHHHILISRRRQLLPRPDAKPRTVARTDDHVAFHRAALSHTLACPIIAVPLTWPLYFTQRRGLGLSRPGAGKIYSRYSRRPPHDIPADSARIFAVVGKGNIGPEISHLV
jgi:hypothetical protein